MDFQTIPTGSIHWFPVTIEQFKNLCNANGHRPNVSFNGDKPVDPLLRDFLLCDGRRYHNKDFPELAKILWKEPIHRWRTIENSVDYLYPFMDEDCNKYGAKGPKFIDGTEEPMKDADGNIIYNMDFTFRVPDLRHQFISSTYIDGTTNVASGSASNGLSNSKNKVGAWCVDNTPPSSSEFREDRHAHFVAYGSYGQPFTNANAVHTGKVSWTQNEIVGSINYKKDLSEVHTINGESFTTFLLHNHPYSFGGNTWHRGFGWRYNTPTQGTHSGVDSIPATMWLSRPNVATSDFVEWRQDYVTKGMSSPDVASVTLPTNYSDIDEEFEGDTKWEEKYEPWSNYQDALYGHESSPKYYAMLPFIKI